MKTEQVVNSETTAQGLDKVTRYNWIMRNAPGQFAMLHKCELAVDPAYQRNKINQRRVDTLMRTWDWVACGCLIVALRDDDKWFVVDGQHRKLAADQRSDIQELPCLVFETTSRREEAQSFLAINQGRVGVGSLDRYRAQLLSGDKTAFAVETLLKSTGHRAGDKPSTRTVSCVQCLYNLAQEDLARFQRLWPLLAELHPDSAMTDLVIKGLWTVDKWLGQRSVTEAPYREKLRLIGGKGLHQEIRREMALIGQGGTRVFACAIAKYLNKQRLATHLKIQLN
jgi:hypothetical protein